MKSLEIELSNSDEYVTTVDEQDYELVIPYRWRLLNNGYVVTGYKKGEVNTIKLLHRFIMGLGQGRVPEVDHIDRNPLNNTRQNLRLVTRGQNILNCGDYSRKHDLPKGVYLMPAGNYRAMGRYKGLLNHLGLFNSVEEAKQARLNWENEIARQGELIL